MKRLLLRLWLVALVGLLTAASIAIAWYLVHWPQYRVDL
jgi:hypothetical protein